MTSSSPANRKNYWKKKSSPSSSGFLQERGLELSPTKTVITHVEHGFDFLGQNVRRYPNGKLLIKPSQKNVGTFLKGIPTNHQRRTWRVCRDLINSNSTRRFAVGRTIIGTW